MTNIKTRVESLIDHLNQGKILEAMDEFYDESIEMQENANPATKGLAANIEREKQFLAQVKEWKSLEVTSYGVGDDSSFVEYNFDFINTDDQPVHYEQVAVQRWKNDKIVHERFYYNAG